MNATTSTASPSGTLRIVPACNAPPTNPSRLRPQPGRRRECRPGAWMSPSGRRPAGVRDLRWCRHLSLRLRLPGRASSQVARRLRRPCHPSPLLPVRRGSRTPRPGTSLCGDPAQRRPAWRRQPEQPRRRPRARPEISFCSSSGAPLRRSRPAWWWLQPGRPCRRRDLPPWRAEHRWAQGCPPGPSPPVRDARASGRPWPRRPYPAPCPSAEGPCCRP